MSDRALQFTICSDLAEGHRIQQCILDEVARHCFDPESTFAIRLALDEALTNAIKHGNKLDRAKKVRVCAKVTGRQAEITIEDEGAGFDRASVPDPTTAENLERLNGRGILLMESYMDQIHWTRGGRCVRMVRKNGREQ